MNQKWKTVVLLTVAEVLAMGLWFSATAVIPTLTAVWGLSPGQSAWLTMAVQIGFVFGTFTCAVLNLPDIWPPPFIFALGAFLGAAANALIAFFPFGLVGVFALRFTTGLSLAAVYPVGMKIMATWMKEDRGIGLGLLVGAVIVGSGFPYLLSALGEIHDWRQLLYLTSALAMCAGILVLLLTRLGPYAVRSASFQWRYIGKILKDEGTRLVGFGYFGHMWELYAMWVWIPTFLTESFHQASSTSWPKETVKSVVPFIAFAVIASGGLSSLLAGYLGDRYGRTYTTIACMILSGTCALLIGQVFGRCPWAVCAIALVWGLTIVADSAQFSTATSELADPAYMGTALTIQICLGFLLTLGSIRLIPLLVDWIGWRWAFSALAVGPAFGIWAMLRLRVSPSAPKLAGGRR